MNIDFRERREAEQRERERQEKERMEKERLQREHRERQERERQERERQREKQLSAVEAVDHHFQLSMELAKKVSPSLQIFRNHQKKYQGFYFCIPLINGRKVSFLAVSLLSANLTLFLLKSSDL